MMYVCICKTIEIYRQNAQKIYKIQNLHYILKQYQNEKVLKGLTEKNVVNSKQLTRRNSYIDSTQLHQKNVLDFRPKTKNQPISHTKN